MALTRAQQLHLNSCESPHSSRTHAQPLCDTAAAPGQAEPSVYFCLVRDMMPPKSSGARGVHMGKGGGGGDGSASAHDTSYYASDHVVCFVAEPSKQTEELE